MRWQWHFGLGKELGYAFWALTFFEATLGAYWPIWPIWIERLGAPIAIVGLVLGFSGLIRPFVLGPGSWLLDRYDSRRVLITARLISIAGLIFAAFSGHWSLLLITVVTTSIGELVFPAIQTYVADNAGDDPVHAFNMVITIGPSVALILSPLVSGLVIAIFGIPGALILAAALAAVALIFVTKMRFSGHLAPDAVPEKTASFKQVAAVPRIRRLIVLHGTTILVLSVGASLMSNFMEDQRDLRASVITVLSAGAAVGTITFGLTSARIRALKQSPVLAASIAIAFVALGFIIIATLPALGFIAIAYIFRGGIFSAWAFYLAEMGKIAPARMRPRGFTIMEILGGSAMSFGPIIAAQLWQIDPRVPFFVSAGIGFVIAVVAFSIARKDRTAQVTESPIPATTP